MLPFALSIFTGAFLLFQIQPLIGKYILPWFGGSPGVWTTCLLFFQTLLLGGYAYAHFSSKLLKPRGQTLLHLGLLVLALIFLPITPSESWKSQISGEPTLHILLLLTATIGLPYFVLSATGPLMQQWFSVTQPGVSPYRLYALSNIGSLLALLSYPVFFEVKFSRHEQATLWSVGLGIFVLLAAWCARQVWLKVPANAAASTDSAAAEINPADEPTTHWSDRLLWIALPAIASVLLLATTNKLCQEVAVIPFLWVLPLALYLLTFVICFDHARWYHRGTFGALLVIGIASVWLLIDAGSDAPMKLQIAGYSATLFVACMICHGELYQLKPPPRQLTSYFLFISAGGALGGLLVAVIAPAIFNNYIELELGLIAIIALFAALCFRHRSRSLAVGAVIGALATTLVLPALSATFDGSDGFFHELLKFYSLRAIPLSIGLGVLIACTYNFRKGELITGWRPLVGVPVIVLSITVGVVFARQLRSEDSGTVLRASRNFYGTLKVFNYTPFDPQEHHYLLMHGATTHGLQFVAPERSFIPTSYYGETSGVGRALKYFAKKGPKSYGVVGLGTGSLATYGQAGDTVRIYEINPAVEKLARDPFTYLAKSPAKLTVVMGDARLEMERELAQHQSQQFDVLALDAFSSDAIPVHLLTQEAFATYLRHLKPGGVIAVHISNRYLDLQPIVEKLAQHFDLATATISDDTDENWWVYSTTWMLVTKDRELLASSEFAPFIDPPRKNSRPGALWTDDNASLYSIMR